MNLWPIFIPSKSRPHAKILQSSLAKFAVVVVEPAEHDLYFTDHTVPCPSRLVLPESSQGIAYVRNYILDHNRQLSHQWFWMLDDDITGFYETSPEKQTRLIDHVEALKRAQPDILSHSNVAQASLEYQQFAWSSTTPWTFNSYCDVAVAINTQLTKTCRYRAEMNLKEDRDFTLQILQRGMRTMRLKKISFKAPTNGSNAGGLADLYRVKTHERRAVDRMVEAWPGVCTAQLKPSGRYDLKIKWSAFK